MLLVRSLCRRTPSLSTSTTALVSRAANRIQSPSTPLVAQQLLSRPELTSSSTSKRFQSNSSKTVTIYFVDRDGEKITAKAKLGQSLLDVAIDNNIDLEGFGACEGTLSCSTCHLILKKENYDKLKPPTDEENDMLDLAFGLTETSRLGCQIIVDDKMNEWTFVVPKEVSDARK